MLLALAIKTWLRIPLAILSGVIFGAYRAAMPLHDANIVKMQIGREVHLDGIASSVSESKNGTLRAVLTNISINYSINGIKSQIYVDLPSSKSGEIAIGDFISISGTLSDGFGDYSASVWRAKLVAVQRARAPDLFLQIRDSFARRVRSLFDADIFSSLALGYLVGDKTGMEDGFVEKLRTVGLSHIVVASGFHLAIFVNLARRLFGKKSRILALVLSMLLITAYVLLVGFGASLLRAAIMASFSLLSWYFGRRLHSFRAAVYAAFIMLLINPSYLTNIAWLLSFSSYLGIVVLEPIIKRFLYGTQKPPAISESILVTISAQLACLPISLYFFGGISVLGVIANLLISPSIAVVIFTTLFSGILPLGALASMFASIAKIILGLHVAIINYLSRWQWGYLSFEPNNPSVLLLYLPILLIVLIMARRESFSFRPRPLLEKCPKNGKIYAC